VMHFYWCCLFSYYSYWGSGVRFFFFKRHLVYRRSAYNDHILKWIKIIWKILLSLNELYCVIFFSNFNSGVPAIWKRKLRMWYWYCTLIDAVVWSKTQRYATKLVIFDHHQCINSGFITNSLGALARRLLCRRTSQKCCEGHFFWAYRLKVGGSRFLNFVRCKNGSFGIWVTGDSHYTRFRCPRFCISAFLFQCYKEHQYPIRGQILKRRTFSRLIRECDADDKLSIKEFWSQFNNKMTIVIRFTFYAF
jgi:hypothetical protein